MAKGISSGGINAIWSTMKHAKEKVGLVRSSQALLSMNSHGGFDCPGCAWPEPKSRSRFEFCENGAKALMNATTKKVIDQEFFRKNSIAELKAWSDHALSNCGRIVTPAIRLPGQTHYQPITYPEAFDIAANHFRALPSKDRAVFYTSGRASNEAAFLYQLFARMLGTNNLCDCSNLCHESSGVALKNTIGIGKGTVQIEDFLAAQVIFLIGHNPSTNHPRMLSTLRDARKNGAAIVVINPLVEPGLKRFRHPQKLSDLFGPAKEIATHYFQVKVGGDHALFNAIAHALLLDPQICHRSTNADFIRTHTVGFAELRASLEKLSFTDLVTDSGLEKDDIHVLAKLIAEHDRVIYAWGMGITQTTYAVKTIEGIVNLALMRGHLGQAGAGLCPVRGHSNVQGNRTVGITEKPSRDFLKRLEQVFGFAPPSEHGLDVVQSIHAMLAGKIDVFMALGGNFLSAGPDTEQTTRALQNCKLAISIATSLNRTHLMAGNMSLLLPCLTRVEKDVQNGREQVITVENSMSIVHASRGHFAPINKDIHSETAIIVEIAKRSLDVNKKVDWQAMNDDYELIRDRIADCLDDFHNYNRRIKDKDGFLLTNPASSRIFKTQSGRAQFFKAHRGPRASTDHDLLLTTIRSHDQFNTAIYGLDDRYRGVKGERRVVFINDRDIERLSLKDGLRVDLVSRYAGVERTAHDFLVRRYEIKIGCAAAYFPEANVLVPLDSVALESNTPTSKLIPIFVVLRRGPNTQSL